MATSDIDIKYVAHLARLALTPEEEANIGAQMDHVLAYMEKLQELDVSQVEPMAHAVPMTNVSRRDEVRPSFSHTAALLNSPAHAGGLFVVPRIIE